MIDDHVDLDNAIWTERQQEEQHTVTYSQDILLYYALKGPKLASSTKKILANTL